MKRQLAYILSAFYLLFSLGMTLEIDKCCFEIASVWGLELSHDDCESHTSSCCPAEKTCDDGKDGHKDCDIIQLNLTIEEVHRTPSLISFNFVPIQTKIVVAQEFKSNLYSLDKIQFIPKEKVPPEPNPIYLLNSSFTFYG